MAKKKSVAKEVVVEKDLVETLKRVDRSKPFTFKREDFSAKSQSIALFEAKSSTSKIEYHGNGEITLHWK